MDNTKIPITNQEAYQLLSNHIAKNIILDEKQSKNLQLITQSLAKSSNPKNINQLKSIFNEYGLPIYKQIEIINNYPYKKLAELKLVLSQSLLTSEQIEKIFKQCQ